MARDVATAFSLRQDESLVLTPMKRRARNRINTTHDPALAGRDGFHPVQLDFERLTHLWTPWKASLPNGSLPS
jgi:hypothetical protein